MPWMGAAFSFFLILTFGLVFNAVQANSIADAMVGAFGIPKLATGLVLAAILALMVLATAASILATTQLGLISFVPFVGLAALPLQVFAWLVRGVVFQFIGLTGVATYLRMHFALVSAEAEVRSASDDLPQVTRA